MPTSWPTQPRSQLSVAVNLFTTRRGVVLHGEPGVGKSQLAADIRQHLLDERPDDYAWFSVSGSALESNIPLSSIDDLLPPLDHADRRSHRRTATFLHTHLSELAAGRTVAIVVDDAHLLDVASAEVLAQACRLGRLSLLATVRSGRSAADQFNRLWRDDLLGRIDVPAFTADEVGQIIGSALGGPVDSALVREVYRSSEGNPMYVRELVRAGVADGSIAQRHGVWLREGPPRVAAALIDLVSAELATLSEPEREAVDLIALAEPVSSNTAHPLIAAPVLGRLVAYGVVRVEQIPGQGKLTDPALRLTHPIYSECVRNMISPAARYEWYSRLYGDSSAPPRHTVKGFLRWTAWTLECGHEIAASDLVSAARAASALGEIEFAIEAATAAIERSTDDQTMIDALSIRSRELYYCELPHDALRDIDAALHVIETGTELTAESVAEAIIANYELRGDIQQFGLDDPEAAMETIDRFFGILPKNDEHTRRHQFAQMVSRSWAGDLVTPLEFVDELVNELNGELEGAPPAMVALAWAGRSAEAKALAAHYASITIPDHALRAGANLRFGSFLMYIVSGRLEEARAGAPDPFSIDESGYFDPAGTYACSARLLAAEGRWREADERFQVARQQSDVCDPFGLRVWSMASEAFSATQVGDDDRARELLLRIDRTPWRASRGLEADIRAQSIRSRLMLRDPSAGEAAADLVSWAAAHDYFLVELWGHELVALADADLARRNGTPDRLAELAKRIDAPIGAPLVGYIRALLDSDPDLEAAATAQLSQLGHWVPRRTTRTVSLSKREAEVVALVVAGLSSRTIAERLHLSPRTVEAHISRVYTKLGINRRSQLADALRTHAS